MNRVPFAHAASDETGSAIVAGAIVLLAIAMLGLALLDVGQWLQHRRNVQVRADAAAFSAGQALNACFNIDSVFGGNATAADNYIESWAENYGGFQSAVSTQTGSPYNPQFGKGTSSVAFQSKDAYPPAANKELGPECFWDGNPANTAPSNVNLMEDVKMTQSGIPPFFSFSPFATVHGWARVQLQAIKSLQPTLPLAVPDVNPKHVAITFVNNVTGEKIAGPFPLSGPTASGTLNDWSGTASITAPGADTNIGVRVSIGSENGDCAGVNSTATYTCYNYSNGGTPSPRGVVAIRSYDSASVTGTKPILRWVQPSTCLQTNAAGGTPYFSAYQAPGGTCDYAGVTAAVDFPSGATAKHVTEQITQGNCNPSTNMTLQSGNVWASSFTSLSTFQGAYDVCLGWTYRDSQNNLHKGTFGTGSNGSPVQQIFSGSDGSDPTLPGGPIMAAAIYDPSTGAPMYSLPAGTTTTVAVTIGLTGGIHINPRCSSANGNSGGSYKCPSDPPVLLRTKAATSNSSLTYTIDCGTIPGHTGGTLYQQLRYGCANSYSINYADQCPDPNGTPTPTDCASVQTGAAVGQARSALNDRLAPNHVCAANNYPATTIPNDPRIVLLVDTDFSAFVGSGGSGKSDVPVVTFATFYITGWSGADSSCTSSTAPINEPPPSNAGSDPNSGNVWGHFINYATGTGTPSGVKCNVAATGACIAALVR